MKTKLFFLPFLISAVFLINISPCASENVKKSVYDREDNGDANDEPKDESLDIPIETEPNNVTCTRKQNSNMHEIRAAHPKEFPFMAAIMSHQNEYLCAGSVVSNGLILTTASCVQQPISYVLLNTTCDKRDDTTVSLHVMKAEKFPTYVGDSSKDVALVYTEKHNNSVASKLKLSNYTNPRAVVDLECLGFGLNADIDQTRELQFIGMENRAPSELFSHLKLYFDCVDTKTPTCFKDTGGPALFDNELMGIITKGQEECSKEMSATYAVNKRMVDVLPTYTFKAWLDEKIKKNEEKEPVALVTFPMRPHPVELQQLTSSGVILRALSLLFLATFVCSFALYN